MDYLKQKYDYKITQSNFERLAKSKIAEQLPIGLDDVYMVWFSFILGNAKGLFSFNNQKAYPMSNENSKVPDYVEVTYNRDTQEMYFDWYVKQRQEILNLKSEVTN